MNCEKCSERHEDSTVVTKDKGFCRCECHRPMFGDISESEISETILHSEISDNLPINYSESLPYPVLRSMQQLHDQAKFYRKATIRFGNAIRSYINKLYDASLPPCPKCGQKTIQDAGFFFECLSCKHSGSLLGRGQQ